MTLHNLANHYNVVKRWLVLKCMQTPLTHYFLKSSGQSAYMKKLTLIQLDVARHSQINVTNPKQDAT